MHNTAKLEQCTEIAGHSTGWCDEDFEDAFGDEYREWCEKNGNEYEINYSNCSEFLDDIGFYDFLEMPDGSDAWSDFGLNPLYDVLREYRDDMTPGEKLILVNRCLDIGHQRGDLASIFIEGGSKTCSAISNGGYQNVSESRTFYLNEEQLKKFKHIVLENTNKSKKIDLDSLPSVIELGDGVYKGMIKGHVFTYNGEKYKTSIGLKNMFPQPWSIQIKNGIETNL